MINKLLAGARAGRNNVAKGSVNVNTLSHGSSRSMAGVSNAPKSDSQAIFRSKAGMDDAKGAYIQQNGAGYGHSRTSQFNQMSRQRDPIPRASQPGAPPLGRKAVITDYRNKSSSKKMSRLEDDKSLSKLLR